MRSKLKWLRKLDIISSEAKLTFNKNGEIRNSTIFGGVLSVLGIITSMIFAVYFLVIFFFKSETSVVTSIENSNFLNITDSHETPFLIRLTDKNNKPYEHPEKMYKINLKYWYGGSNNTLENIGQKTIDIPIEKCDIEKHFGKFQELFLNLTDLNTFYCAKVRPYNQSIYGVYGNVYPFGYYHFYVSMCLGDDICDEKDSLEEEFSNTYLDVRTVDYDIDSYHHKNCKQPYIKTERFMISMTVYKRIWFYIKAIKYIKDEGFWIEKKQEINFYQYDSLRYDIDHRNIFNGTIPGTFATLTFVTSGNIMIYYQRFTKIQELIGTLSGVAKFIMVITTILNYSHSKNAYYLKLMNDFLCIDIKFLKKKEYEFRLGFTLSNFSKIYQNTYISSYSNVNSSGMSNTQVNNHCCAIHLQNCVHSLRKANTKVNPRNLKIKPNQTFTSVIPISKIHQQHLVGSQNENKTHKSKNKIKLGICSSVLPLNCLFKKEKYGEALKLYYYIINEKLNLIRILQEIDKISLLDEWLRINDSLSTENYANQLNPIQLVNHNSEKYKRFNNK
jgi:hypothetical protein